MAYKALDVLFGKIQSAIDTPQTELTDSDFRAVNEGFDIAVNQEMSPIKIATGCMGQEKSVPGMASAEVSIQTYIVPTDSTTNPSCYDYLTSSGMDATRQVEVFTFTPTSTPLTWKAMTFHQYTGDKVTESSFLTVAQNVMFEAEINVELGKPCELILTGKGIIPSMPDATTYPTHTCASIAQDIPAVMKASTFTVFGSTLKGLKFNAKLGNQVELVKDISATYGYKGAEIVDRASTWTATVYESNAFTGWDNMATPTVSTLSITFGSEAGKKITIASSANKAQITSIKKADEAGVNTIEVSGIFIDNDWYMSVNV